MTRNGPVEETQTSLSETVLFIVSRVFSSCSFPFWIFMSLADKDTSRSVVWRCKSEQYVCLMGTLKRS